MGIYWGPTSPAWVAWLVAMALLAWAYPPTNTGCDQNPDPAACYQAFMGQPQ